MKTSEIIHKDYLNRPHNYSWTWAVCMGRRIDTKRAVRTWNNVTCKNCLKTKTK